MNMVPAPIGPVDASVNPRFAGIATFARLPRAEEVESAEIAIMGVPFDSGVSYRPGARFAPSHIREISRLLRPYHPELDVSPFAEVQVVDAGDVSCNPFNIPEALATIQSAAASVLDSGARLVAIGGDHTIALPLLREMSRKHGPVAMLHFDAHLDTWDSYFGADYTHGTPFRRAFEEGLLDIDALSHVGIRGPLYSKHDLDEDARMGFGIVTAMDVMNRGPQEVALALRDRIGDRPLYVSIDIDCLDPAHAPGTGTPEAGGLTSRELLAILRGLAGCQIVGADVVEVAPAYDHADVTAVAASHLAYELIALMALNLSKAPQSARNE